MNVRPIAERYCYEVQSETDPRKWYRVDLTANNGAGVCPCTDWATRRQPALDRGEKPLTRATLCKHARAALWAFLREVMPALARDEDARGRPAPISAPQARNPQSTRP